MQTRRPSNRRHLSRIALAVGGVALMSSLAPGQGRTWFREVGPSRGLDHRGPSYGGGAWGDYDADGDPDLYVTGHFQNLASLFENDGTGRFTEVSSQRFSNPPVDRDGDFHGPAWCDYDNDGDLDLLVAHGAGSGSSAGPNRFFVNDGSRLTDFATALDIDYALGRARTALWLPYNQVDGSGLHDPRLDVLLTTQKRSDGAGPTALFLAVDPNPRFVDITPAVQLPNASFDSALLTDLSGNGQLDIVLGTTNKLRVFELNTAPIVELTSSLGLNYRQRPQDLAAGDFDGDGLMDLFVAQRNKLSGYQLLSPKRAEVTLLGSAKSVGVGIALAAQPAQLQLDFTTRFYKARDIFIGSQGIVPADKSFVLDWNNLQHYGLPPFVPGVDHGIYLGIDPATLELELWASSNVYFEASCEARSGAGVRHLTPFNFDPNEPFTDDALFFGRRDGSGAVKMNDRIQISGIPARSNTAGVVSGDFDNDGDVDLFTLSYATVTNLGQQHHLWANRGDGTFSPIPDAGGIRVDPRGRADAVSVVDFDRDGWLDLFITNGEGNHPASYRGRSQLLRNVRKRPGHHWLLVDLEGTTSNRNGVGARLEVVVGGRTLVREMTGGVHRSTQDDASVVHFGLGTHSTVSSLEIVWPSGTRQTLTNVAADQVVQVIEP